MGAVVRARKAPARFAVGCADPDFLRHASGFPGGNDPSGPKALAKYTAPGHDLNRAAQFCRLQGSPVVSQFRRREREGAVHVD
jgi:hypothetical protein